MKRKLYTILALIFASALFIVSCKDSTIVNPSGQGKLKLPEVSFDYLNEFNKVVNEFGQVNDASPEITNDGATLGRVLFYDANLSLNNAISCASCHHQDKAFADGQALSTGFQGKITPRNSMAIINPATNNNLFWDSRSSSALDLALKPVKNHIEMGMEDMDHLTIKLKAIEYYPALFEKAYGDQNITEERIGNALAQFLCSIRSSNSKFDQGAKNAFAEYTPLEKLGKELFFSEKTKCARCHSGKNFSAPDFPHGAYGQPEVKGTANIGLDVVYKDEGKGDGKFRIPSLRNIALTGPYMHDGRFNTLDEVIEHYNDGIANHPELDHNLMADGKPIRMNLSKFERDALVAFLNTLTDLEMTKDPKYSNPFIH